MWSAGEWNSTPNKTASTCSLRNSTYIGSGHVHGHRPIPVCLIGTVLTWGRFLRTRRSSLTRRGGNAIDRLRLGGVAVASSVRSRLWVYGGCAAWYRSQLLPVKVAHVVTGSPGRRRDGGDGGPGIKLCGVGRACGGWERVRGRGRNGCRHNRVRCSARGRRR